MYTLTDYTIRESLNKLNVCFHTHACVYTIWSVVGNS